MKAFIKKLFTHNYSVTIMKNGKFCWISEGWVEKTKDELIFSLMSSHAFMAVIFIILMI